MSRCPACGAEFKDGACPSCGTVYVSHTQRKKVSVQRRDSDEHPSSSGSHIMHEIISRPPAPKNQPALLQDASPVFSPFFDEEPEFPCDTDPVAAEAESEDAVSNDCSEAESANDSDDEAGAENSELSDSSTSENNALGTADSYQMTDSAGITDNTACEADVIQHPADDSDSSSEDLKPADTQADDNTPYADFPSDAELEEAEEDDQSFTCSEGDDDSDEETDKFSFAKLLGSISSIFANIFAKLPRSLHFTFSLLGDMLSGSFSRCTEKLCGHSSPVCWQWLFPVQLLIAIPSLAVCGLNIIDAPVFNRFGVSVVSAAILWLENFAVLLLLLSLLFLLTGRKFRFFRYLEITSAALLPLAFCAVPAAIFSYFFAVATAPLLIFGIFLSAFFLWYTSRAAGALKAKGGKFLTTLFLLLELIFSAVIINGMI